jgi:addiction module HigA family antidote
MRKILIDEICEPNQRVTFYIERVTPDTALRLARFFGNSPEFWLNLQQLHDLSKARIELSKTIEREVEAYAGA